MDENAGTLIDVRTPREFQAGAIPGTKLNVNVSDRNFKTEIGKLDKDKTYLVYCLSGARSSHAARIMESMGFKHLYNLKGGYRGWKGAGF
ncbi:MAG TPA: rhodanese-like domain-containing protein [Saprospiraceae bacterium]|nr:rhodanese-like domain-containing protein [Saprospiraceae bacterium]